MDVSVPVAIGVAGFGVLTGVLSALFGVGGGLVMVPFMVLALGRSQHLAEGTSLLVIVPTAVTGMVAHARRGFVSFKHAAILAVGGVGGSYLGARFALTLEGDLLQTIFGGFLAIMGIRTVIQARKGRAGKAG
ncbi:MAG: sulfite exporter TauE/SafE family protein [Actinomycetota bacterium]